MIFNPQLKYGYPEEMWKNLQNFPGEKWADIEGYEGWFQISNYGRIKSLFRLVKNNNGYRRKYARIRSSDRLNGYHRLEIVKDKIKKTFLLSRLVAYHFIKKQEGMTVNHKDGNKNNNHVSNLEWVTIGENLGHALKTGLRKIRKVNQIDKNTGCIMNTFKSTHEVSTYLNISWRYAKRIVQFKRLYKGYIWTYS